MTLIVMFSTWAWLAYKSPNPHILAFYESRLLYEAGPRFSAFVHVYTCLARAAASNRLSAVMEMSSALPTVVAFCSMINETEELTCKFN